MQEKGFLSLVLHSHLPFVRHLKDNSALEEEWLYEAITETYIPLINTFSNLIKKNVDFNITLSLSPTLITMLTDELLQQRYLTYINRLIELSEKELKRTKSNPTFYTLAKDYYHNFIYTKEVFKKYNNNLITAFRELQEIGVLEVITCPATHGYLPLMHLYPEAVKAQIKIGLNTYKNHFNSFPEGIWLPECGYFPGLDEFLYSEGIRYFLVDTHGLINAIPRPHYANFAPIYCPSGVAAFARDSESSNQVWSSQDGYPGDFDYREFYRDIGFDLDYEYIKDYIHPEGFRKNTGIKYHRITNRDNNYKEVYNLDNARDKAAIHADNFIFNRQSQIEYLNKQMDRKPIIVSPYDTELFGHWWHEGPIWLQYLIEKLHFDQNKIKLITPKQYLNIYPTNQVATPSLSSWGADGYNQVWLNDDNDWIYPKLHSATEKFIALANNIDNPTDIKRRVLNQMARELLLAQSSDWAFIIKTNTMKEYAIKRTEEHLNNFSILEDYLKHNIDVLAYLEKLEEENNIFPNIDYKIYQSSFNLNYKEVNI